MSNILLASTMNIGGFISYTKSDSVSYIFYDINAISGDGKHTFLDEANIRKEQLEKKYGSKVIIIGVTNASQFEEKWNNMIGFDEDGKKVSVNEVYLISMGLLKGIKERVLDICTLMAIHQRSGLMIATVNQGM